MTLMTVGENRFNLEYVTHIFWKRECICGDFLIVNLEGGDKVALDTKEGKAFERFWDAAGNVLESRVPFKEDTHE